ncbi:hypothetical protein EDB86DRAFT_2953734 [Lactarius hatsudake]|nr:hypothetical protein EDB86DRAFT_2953734 [Lactarius hatsudake]
MVFIVLLFAMQVMSLPTFQNITYDSLNGHHLIIAVIVIFKHATFLRLKGLSSESSLTQAELDYREANTDLIIQEHLTGSSQDSVELSASFIMATDIESSRSSVKEHWFKRLLNQRSHANLEDPHKEGLLDSVSNGPGNV